MNHNYKLLIFDEIDSTNSEAIRIAKATIGAYRGENYAILAKTQTKGRGRSGKNWQSMSGNFHASLLLKPIKELEFFPQLSFVTSLAVYDCISFLSMLPLHERQHCEIVKQPGTSMQQPSFNHQYTGSNNLYIKLKWPNDVLVNGKKISGILLESINIENNIYIIIGVGINIARRPTNINKPTTSLVNENFLSLSPKTLLNLFITNFEKYYQIWQKEEFTFIRNLWLQNAYKLNEEVTAKDGERIITGIFKDIDALGRIILLLPSKEVISLEAAELIL
jgi:BirA family biotin operon repressor/biotin-[acetyl-CoA-carboxylase] ligase